MTRYGQCFWCYVDDGVYTHNTTSLSIEGG